MNQLIALFAALRDAMLPKLLSGELRVPGQSFLLRDAPAGQVGATSVPAAKLWDATG